MVNFAESCSMEIFNGILRIEVKILKLAFLHLINNRIEISYHTMKHINFLESRKRPFTQNIENTLQNKY